MENNEMNQNRKWPSADDHHIRYNAHKQDGIEIWDELHSEMLEKDPYLYFYSSTQKEIEKENIADEILVADNAAEIVLTYLKSVNYPLENEFFYNPYETQKDELFVIHGDNMGLFDPMDRTVQTPVVDTSIFTTDFTKHIQQTL